jgi:hypothetical protein
MRGLLSPNLALIVLAVALSLLVFEAYLRIDDRRPEATYAAVEIDGWQLPLFDDPGKLARLDEAVLLLGDSFTEGAACGREGNFPAVFEELAQAAGADLVAINLGIEGVNTFAYLALARALLGGDERPRGAIATLFVNDIERDCSMCPFLAELQARGAVSAAELAQLEAFCAQCAGRHDDITAHYTGVRRLHRWLYAQSWAYRLTRDASYQVLPLLGLQAGWGAAYPEQWQDRAGLNYRLLEASLVMLAETAREAEVPLLVTLYPPARPLTRDAPYLEVYARAANDLERRLGAPVRSGYDFLLDHPQAEVDMAFSLTDAHPSCDLHRLYAQWVWEEWQRHVLEPEGAPAPPAS